jgi:hypothetical protein
LCMLEGLLWCKEAYLTIFEAENDIISDLQVLCLR